MARQLRLLVDSPFFDPGWYVQQFSEEAITSTSAYEHYLLHGAAEGRNPGPDFDGHWYLQRYPDVAAAGQNPLIHYIEHGKAEGREIRPAISAQQARPLPKELEHSIEVLAKSHLFDPEWYLREYPDVAAAGENPIVHYLSFGAAEGRNPGPDFDGRWYVNCHSDVAGAHLNPLLHYLEAGASEGREIRRVIRPNALEKKIEARFGEIEPLHAFLIPSASRRLTVVLNDEPLICADTDTQVAVIVGALLASHMRARLRFATRAIPDASVFTHIWAANGITWTSEIEFVHTAGDYSLAISENDFFLTTSWKTTWSAMKSVNSSRVIYLVQDDERMAYPFGDDRLRCEEILTNPELLFMVASEMLFAHLTTGSSIIENVRRRGVCFECAVPRKLNASAFDWKKSASKRNFFFDARQSLIGNLYWRGLEVIQEALEEGLFKGSNWEFYFLSNSPDDLILPGDIRPIFMTTSQWAECTDLLARSDVALCLADTPYFSYPILELAANGAVVVTNARRVHRPVASYSENVLYADPSIDHLKHRIGDAIRLATDDERRLTNYFRQQIVRDWTTAIESALDRVMSVAGIERWQAC